MQESFEKLKGDFATSVVAGVTEANTRVASLASLAYRALTVKADSAADQTKRAAEIAVGIADLHAASGVSLIEIRRYAKIGRLLVELPDLVEKSSARCAYRLDAVVDYDAKSGKWTVDANHVATIRDWLDSNAPKDIAGVNALRDACGKAPKARAKKAKNETPANGPLPVNDESVGAYFASRATESIVDDMIAQASPDQRVLIGEALGRHMSAECFLRMVRDFLYAHGEEPDCLLALYEIGKDLELAQVAKVAEGYIAQQGEDESDGPKNYKDFTDMVRKAAHDTFKKQPVAA